MNLEFERFKDFGKDGYFPCRIFDTPLGVELGQLCLTHAESNTSGIIGEKNLILVHPYFSILADKEPKSPKITNMENLVRNTKEVRKILFEDFLHYAHKSHEFVDEGLIDKVFFTTEDNDSDAVPVNLSDLKKFSNSKLNYICGSYSGGRCVDYVISKIRGSRSIGLKYAPYFSIRPIKDAILFKQLYGWWDKLEEKSTGAMHGVVSRFNLLDRLYYFIMGTTTSKILKK